MKFGIGKASVVTTAAILTLACSTFAADWYAKETRWAGHDPDIIRYEDGYALATTDNHMLMQFSEDALNWKNGEPLTHATAKNKVIVYSNFLIIIRF